MSDKKNKKNEIHDEKSGTQSTEEAAVETSEVPENVADENLPEAEDAASDAASLTAEIEELKAQIEQLNKDKLLLMADLRIIEKGLFVKKLILSKAVVRIV